MQGVPGKGRVQIKEGTEITGAAHRRARCLKHHRHRNRKNRTNWGQLAVAGVGAGNQTHETVELPGVILTRSRDVGSSMGCRCPTEGGLGGRMQQVA